MLEIGVNISGNLTAFFKQENEKMKIDNLKKKTILLIFIMTVLCIAGSVFMASQVIEKHASGKYKTDNETSIEVLSYSLAPMLDLYDYKQIEQLITSSLSYENIASVAVFNGGGTLIKSAAERNVIAENLDLEKREVTTSLEGIIGSIEIGFSKEYINNRIRKMTAALIFGLLGIFVFLGTRDIFCLPRTTSTLFSWELDSFYMYMYLRNSIGVYDFTVGWCLFQ